VEATNSSAAIGIVDDAAEILRREAGTTVVQA
jgi:carbamate kinase